ncbi:hypothetical protein ACGFIS_37420, partial [Spirillospora sp. NPDC048824]
MKVLWLAGFMVGVPEDSAVREGSFVAANAVTLVLDAVGLLLALTFACRWGRRVPAWPLLVPIWVGTGLLAPGFRSWWSHVMPNPGSGLGERRLERERACVHA